MCGPLSVPPQQGRKVVTSARMEALSCSIIINQQDFEKRSLGLDPQQIACMTAGGFASLTGPQGKVLIHLVPQLLK